MTDNDNNKGGTPPILIPDRKIVDLTGKPLSGLPRQGTVPPLPRSREFEINLRSGNTFAIEGFLVATPSFLGVGNQEGELKLVIPLDALDYAVDTRELQTVLDIGPDGVA